MQIVIMMFHKDVERIKTMKNKFRVIIILLAIFLLLVSLPACGARPEDQLIKELEGQIAEAEEKLKNGVMSTETAYNTSAVISLDEVDFDSIDFTEITCADISADMENNPLRGKTYIDSYVKLTGYVSSYFDGVAFKGFTIYPSMIDHDLDNNSGYDIYCELLSQEQEDAVNTYYGGAEIVVYGKIVELREQNEDFVLNVIKVDPLEEPSLDSIDFTAVSAQELAIEATDITNLDKYEGKYIKVTGVIDKIELDEFVIAPDRVNAYAVDTHCRYSNEAQENIIAGKSVGDTVTVWGKVVSIYSDYFYGVDIGVIELHTLQID